ncbi:MAG: hypothetical protein E7Z98_04615 [Olsenella sp.]|nr:hypothetical protein [Olsenella sp.]
MGVRLLEGSGGASASVIYLLNFEGDDVGQILAGAAGLRSTLVVVPVERWDEQMSPWPAESPYGKGACFPGGAPSFIDELLGRVMPEAEAQLGLRSPVRALAGYSLAGLFALWALASRPDALTGAASCSGSLWYPGWTTWLEENAPQLAGHAAYLSLGSRESRVKNPLVAKVGECTDRTAGLLRALGAEVLHEANPGGHFTDVPGRISRGLASLDALLVSCRDAG